MKKPLAMLLAGLFASAAMASDIVVINPQAKTSPTTGIAMTFQKNVSGSSFYQGESCNDAVKKYEATPNSAIVFGTNMAITGMRKNAECMPKVNQDSFVFYGEQYYQICTKAGSGKNFRTPNATYGMASVQPVAAIVADINKQNGTTLKPMAFSGSGAVALQLLSGDLDIGLVGTSLAAKHIASGALECFASTDPADSKFHGKQLKMKKPDFRIQTLILTETKDPAVRARLQAAAESGEFQGLLKKGQFHDVETKSSQKLVDKTESYIKGAHAAYGQ